MSVAPRVTVTCRIERKDPRLPRFVVVPSRLLARWALTATTVVDATVNGVAVGRRSLKRWDDERWFVDLPQTACARLGVDTGDAIELSLARAAEVMPEELSRLIAEDPRVRRAWAGLTGPQQRMLRENVLAAKTSEALRRRSLQGLGLRERGR